MPTRANNVQLNTGDFINFSGVWMRNRVVDVLRSSSHLQRFLIMVFLCSGSLLLVSRPLTKDLMTPDVLNNSFGSFRGHFSSGQLPNVNRSMKEILSDLEYFLKDIKEIGNHLLKAESNLTLREIKSPWTTLSAFNEGFFEKLEQFPTVQTLFFRHDLNEMKHRLVPVYYEYTSNDCKLVEQHTGYDTDLIAMYNNSCHSDLNVLFNGHGILEKNMRVGLPYNFTHLPAHETWTYMHVIHNGVVTANGDVLTDNLIMVPQRCKPQQRGNLPLKPNHLPQYNEVFSVHQYWDTGFYHSSMEGIPRLAPYVQLLNDNPAIKIHLHSHNNLLQFLGIRDFEKRRLGHENFRAKVVYSPAGGPCGRSPLFNTQLLSLYARQDLQNNPHTRNKIILIKRSAKRFFKKHNAIANMLEALASEHGLELFIFNDRPLPSQELTRRMFNEAIMIVAPHGAGESNMLFSQPGTVLIEGLCWEQPHRVILCYRNAAQVLGLRYYGLFFNKGCFDVTPEEVKTPANFFLKRLDLLRNS